MDEKILKEIGLADELFNGATNGTRSAKRSPVRRPVRRRSHQTRVSYHLSAIL